MGSMAAEPMVDFSIASVRKIGKWTEEIFVITDKPACFTGNRFVLIRSEPLQVNSHKKYLYLPSSPAEGNLSVTIIPVPSAKSVIEIKALKPIVLELLPGTSQQNMFFEILRLSNNSLYGNLLLVLLTCNY